MAAARMSRLPLSSTGIWFSSVSFAAAIDLAIGQRIGAQIVRRERPLPARQRGVLQHRLQLACTSAGLKKRKNGAEG